MMKTIKKIDDSSVFALEQDAFTFGEALVQGAKVGKKDNAMLIVSPRRFKLFTEDTDLVKIVELNGEGHFKWSRGELNFKQGDCFEVSGVGEYEFTANGTFLVIRK